MGPGDSTSTHEALARVTYLPWAQPPIADEAELATPTAMQSEFPTALQSAAGPAAESGSFSVAAQSELPSSRGRDRSETRAENVSMHALTRRGMSRWELEKTLLSRELDTEVIAEELDRLQSVGLIDDASLAETFVRTQHERKGLGRGALTAELRRRHVGQDDIDAALAQIDDDDEQTRATELAVKRAGQLSSYDLDTAKRRLHGFLSRKGYSSSVVRTAIDEALSPRSSGVRFR